MDRPGQVAQDYIATIGGGTDELKLLQSIPWVIDAGVQDPEQLYRALKFDSTRFDELPARPVFSIVVVLRASDLRLVEEMILSMRCQSWTRWELIIVVRNQPPSIISSWIERDVRIQFVQCDPLCSLAKARDHAVEQATGDFVGFLDSDAILHPSTLGIFARRWNADPDANIIFGNEARLDPTVGKVNGFFSKPPFDPFTLLRVDSVGQLVAIRRDFLMTAHRACQTGCDGVADQELALNLAATGLIRPIQIPLFLCYRRTSPLQPVVDPEVALSRLRLAEVITPLLYPNMLGKAHWPNDSQSAAVTLRLSSPASRSRPSLLVVIPFKDQVALTLECVASIERQEHDLDVTVILVDNNSIEPETSRRLAHWIEQPRRCCYELHCHQGPFNYARINNQVVQQFGSESALILFLNNDVELISTDCLETMATHLLADDRSGVVGMRLMYPGGEEVQHGGVKLMRHQVGSGYNVIGHSTEATDFVFIDRITFGVTFACAMVRRSVFDQLGGLEEIMMPNAFGDVDFCSRAVEAGYRNYYFGTLVGIHAESKTRGRAAEDVEFTALHQRHGQTFATWRLSTMTYQSTYTWPLVAVSPKLFEPQPAPPLPLIPLRHRVVDHANGSLKVALGPLHQVLRRGLVLAFRTIRQAKLQIKGERIVRTDPKIFRRPFALRRRESTGGLQPMTSLVHDAESRIPR